MKIFLRAWGAIAIASMLVYGFSGAGLWAPFVNSGDAPFRFMVLFMFHIGGVLAIITSSDIEATP